MPPRAQVNILRCRGFCFTLNHYTAQEEQQIQQLEGAVYVIYGREVGENGVPHLQGYVHFKNQKHFNKVANMVPRWHVEQRMGTLDQAIDYCKKDGDIFEWGIRPLDVKERTRKAGAGNADRWRRIIQLAEAGDLDTLKQEEPKVYLQNLPRLATLQRSRPPNIDGDLQNEWWVGPTGTGKSRLLWELYPDHFSKKLSKWWDGYNRQDVVAIEEWCPKHEVTASSLKVWADRYVFDGEVKGGTLMHLRPQKIIVLSNYTIEQCFPNEEDREPILRRFKVIKFPESKSWARVRGINYNNKQPQPDSDEPMPTEPETERPDTPRPQLERQNSEIDWATAWRPRTQEEDTDMNEFNIQWPDASEAELFAATEGLSGLLD